MLGVSEAKYVEKYNIHLVFNNGKEGIADLEKTITCDNREIFYKLRDESSFKNFKISHNTIVWFDELDLAPEYLFFLVFKEDVNLQKKFRSWGYIA